MTTPTRMNTRQRLSHDVVRCRHRFREAVLNAPNVGDAHFLEVVQARWDWITASAAFRQLTGRDHPQGHKGVPESVGR